MSDEPQARPITLTREELYQQVWTTPMSQFAKRYALSDRGLAKICERANVPCPPRGYWAKLQAGKPMSANPLPTAKPGTPAQITITPNVPSSIPPKPPVDTGLARQLEDAHAKASDVRVPGTLRNPHPIIAAWLREHEQKVAAAKLDRSPYAYLSKPKPVSELERRQQRILDTLFKALEQRGLEVRRDGPYRVWLEYAGERIEFTLGEHIRQVRRPLTKEEKASDSWYSRNKFRQEKVPTGRLRLQLRTYLGNALPCDWREDERPLEEQMPEIVAVFSLAGPILQEQRRAREEAERRRWEEEQKRREQRELEQQDRNRWRRFVDLAQLWKEGQLAARFLALIEMLPVQSDETYGEHTGAEWLTWARRHVSEYDILSQDCAVVWQDIASITAWHTPSERGTD